MRIDVEEALKRLEAGEVVAVPTETVYGLAVDPKQAVAVEKLFALKGRPTSNPISQLVASVEDFLPVLKETPQGLDALAQRFWPGPLTLACPVEPEAVDPRIRAGLPTAGFRMPAHPLTLGLLRRFGCLAVPSANLSGKLSATSAEHVEADFGADFPVLDGGDCQRGVESTVLLYDGGCWKTVRPGLIGAEELAAVLGYAPEAVRKAPSKELPHYQSRVQLAWGTAPFAGVVLGFEGRKYPEAEKVYCLGSLSQPEVILTQVYSVLRQLDADGVSEALVDPDFPEDGPFALLRTRLNLEKS
jgi:L-threonylcarbamoyladenylate synthase